jgi:hypothetical protein
MPTRAGAIPPRLGSTCLACAQFAQEFIRWHEEGIDLQDPTNNHHWMGAEDIHNDPCAKLGEIVCSYNCIIVLRQDIVQPGLVLDQVIDPWSILQGPLHVGY